MTFETLFPDSWLPERPRVTDRKGNPTWRVSRDTALGTMPYIEPNASHVLQSLVITDRDLIDSDRIADNLGLPHPSYVALNPHTTTGHIVYALKDPVCLTDAARRPPVNLLARVEHGLSDVLGGDPGYGGSLTKNPFHVSHATLWGPQDALYGLRDLAKALDDLGALPNARNPRKHVQRSAVGRNVALFDETRQWAYRGIRKYWDAPAADWNRAVYARATLINETIIANEFSTGPLSYTEVVYLARSIATWVRNRADLGPRAQTTAEYDATFHTIQTARSAKAAAKRAAVAEVRRLAMLGEL
ncbi:replication initiation protein [Plantibacter sp. RU18]|uniref:replication initiation protein n=1 Tax=Plantibacter sp. RU18 TaxID=3158143 RepID=UPI003D35F4F9